MATAIETAFTLDDVIEETSAYVPQCIVTVRDPDTRLTAYVAIDAAIGGRACGGMRISHDVSLPSLTALARGMTLKYGFLGVPQGGAKGGIVGDQEMSPERKHALLRRLGELIGPMLRSQMYISGPDLATTAADIQHMLDAAGVRVPSPRRHRGKKSGYYTALGVQIAVETCAESDSLDLRGRTVAIEGFGAVGSALASLLHHKKGMRVVAVSTTAGARFDPRGLDVDRLLNLRELKGNESVLHYNNGEPLSNEDLLTLDVDFLCPCAAQYPVTVRNANGVRARYVCPGANNPVSRKAEAVLAGKGILSIPYFAANCGGVFGNRLEVLGVSDSTIEATLRRKNGHRIRRLIDLFRSDGTPMIERAEQYALDRFRSMQGRDSDGEASSVLRRRALQLFNTGVVPGPVVRLAADQYISRTMLNDPPVS